MGEEEVPKRQYRRYEYFAPGPRESLLATGVNIVAFVPPSAELLEQARAQWISVTGQSPLAHFTHVIVNDLVELPEQPKASRPPLLVVPGRSGEQPS